MHINTGFDALQDLPMKKTVRRTVAIKNRERYRGVCDMNCVINANKTNNCFMPDIKSYQWSYDYINRNLLT